MNIDLTNVTRTNVFQSIKNTGSAVRSHISLGHVMMEKNGQQDFIQPPSNRCMIRIDELKASEGTRQKVFSMQPSEMSMFDKIKYEDEIKRLQQ